MTVTQNEPVVPRALSERAKNLLKHPAAEWAVIDTEPATVQGLYRGYLCWLAAVGPVCWLIGSVVFGRTSIASAVPTALVLYLVWLVAPYLAALAIEALAPRFGGEKNRIQALKVAVYAPTASMLSGVFSLIPALSFLAIVGLYSLYLLWVGLPRLMRVPAERAGGFYAVTLLVLIGIGIVVGLALSLPLGAMRAAP